MKIYSYYLHNLAKNPLDSIYNCIIEIGYWLIFWRYLKNNMTHRSCCYSFWTFGLFYKLKHVKKLLLWDLSIWILVNSVGELFDIVVSHFTIVVGLRKRCIEKVLNFFIFKASTFICIVLIEDLFDGDFNLLINWRHINSDNYNIISRIVMKNNKHLGITHLFNNSNTSYRRSSGALIHSIFTRKTYLGNN